MFINSRHRVRDCLQESLQNYYATKGHAVADIDSAIRVYGLELDSYELMDLPGNEGSKYIPILDISSQERMDSFLVFEWHRMPSGRYEITAYIS